MKFLPNRQLKILAAFALSGAALLAGCASVPPPTEQMALAKAAVTRATSAGGNEFAPVEMKSAIDKLDAADRAIGAKDYDRARQLAEQAQVDARAAEARAQNAKAQKALAETQESNRVLREEINRKSP
jgi:septal ring factor EnvC (AmiA/AmiB activator)